MTDKDTAETKNKPKRKKNPDKHASTDDSAVKNTREHATVDDLYELLHVLSDGLASRDKVVDLLQYEIELNQQQIAQNKEILAKRGTIYKFIFGLLALGVLAVGFDQHSIIKTFEDDMNEISDDMGVMMTEMTEMRKAMISMSEDIDSMSTDFSQVARDVNAISHGVGNQRIINAEFFSSAEYESIVTLGGQLEGLLQEGAYVQRGERSKPVAFFKEALGWLMDEAKRGQHIQRYKGLGEMNPEQLWETTLDSNARRLLQVQIEDAIAADEIFTTLMGDKVEPRREFIEANALQVANLDV